MLAEIYVLRCAAAVRGQHANNIACCNAPCEPSSPNTTCRNQCALQGTCRTSRFGIAFSWNAHHTQHFAVFAAFLPFFVRGAFLLICWFAHSSYAFGNQSSCARPPGLRKPLEALREAWPRRLAIALWLRAPARRDVAFRPVSHSAVHQTPRVAKARAVLALSWKSRLHWACLLMLPATWFHGACRQL